VHDEGCTVVAQNFPQRFHLLGIFVEGFADFPTAHVPVALRLHLLADGLAPSAGEQFFEVADGSPKDEGFDAPVPRRSASGNATTQTQTD